MSESVLLGDEALALGAVHAGLSCGFGYPGTPSTEILEFLIDNYEKNGGPLAQWCTNEKTAYESALGASFVGKRTIVTMKHVGLNACADAFMNSSLLGINGGLVVVVADDPSMHSSQGEQDTNRRRYGLSHPREYLTNRQATSTPRCYQRFRWEDSSPS